MCRLRPLARDGPDLSVAQPLGTQRLEKVAVKELEAVECVSVQDSRARLGKSGENARQHAHTRLVVHQVAAEHKVPTSAQQFHARSRSARALVSALDQFHARSRSARALVSALVHPCPIQRRGAHSRERHAGITVALHIVVEPPQGPALYHLGEHHLGQVVPRRERHAQPAGAGSALEHGGPADEIVRMRFQVAEQMEGRVPNLTSRRLLSHDGGKGFRARNAYLAHAVGRGAGSHRSICRTILLSSALHVATIARGCGCAGRVRCGRGRGARRRCCFRNRCCRRLCSRRKCAWAAEDATMWHVLSVRLAATQRHSPMHKEWLVLQRRDTNQSQGDD